MVQGSMQMAHRFIILLLALLLSGSAGSHLAFAANSPVKLIDLVGLTEGATVRGVLVVTAKVSGKVAWVTFRLSGPHSQTWTERRPPFIFLGHDEATGHAHGWNTTRVPDGTYSLSVEACDAGGSCDRTERHFQVANRVAPPASPPLSCKQGEVAVDAQDWWVTTPGKRGRDGKVGDSFGHIHVAACFPHLQTVSGKMTLTVRSTMHHNPGQYRRLLIQLYEDDAKNPVRRCGDDFYGVACLNFDPPRRCPLQQTCSWTDTLTFDTRDVRSDGWKQLRIRPIVAQDGKLDDEEMIASTGLQLYVKNGRRVKNTYQLQGSYNYVEARGWYTDSRYANAVLFDPPTKPVSGIWQPEVLFRRGTRDSAPITGWYAALDTDFHQQRLGTPLCPKGRRGPEALPICGDGEWRGRLRIDTTKLADGWHRLFLKADAFHARSGSTNSGALAILFEVRNHAAAVGSAQPVAFSSFLCSLPQRAALLARQEQAGSARRVALVRPSRWA